MTNFSDYFRINNEGLTQSDILELSVDQLLGIDSTAAEILISLGINTVFDLGSSWLFAKAKAAAESAKEDNISQRVGLIPSDWLEPNVAFEELTDIASLPLENLSGISTEQALNISNALGVTTIHDFAFWLPYRTARRIVSEASGSTLDIEEKNAEKLRPRLGDYPTERVYYDRLIMLQLDTDDAVEELEGPISITPAIDTPLGFGKPAIGALLTYSQSWYTKAITLGQMLHSLALAPGEATRIAVVDWSRRTSTSATEAISEAEKLNNSTEHSRAMSEVTNAVAQDMQKGGSTTSGWADSSSESTADSGGSGLLTSLVDSGGFSDTTQSSRTRSGAESTSWSNGNKSVMANMTQDINDSTEQHSNSVRNRRASAVREVSQTEHEEVSTRIVANYNHMHALTIQYYEVVQVYQVETQLHKAVRCLFIPVEMLDFRGENGLDIVERFRGILLNGALSRSIRNILIDDSTTVEVTPLEKAVFVDTSSTGRTAILPERTVTAAFMAADATTAGDTPADVAASSDDKPKPFRFTGNFVWNRIEVENTSAVLGRSIVRADSNSLHLPDETELVGMSFENLNLANVKLDIVGASNKTLPVTNPDSYAEVPAGIYLREVDSISVKRASDDSLNSGFMILHCSYFGRRFKVPAILLKLQLGTAMQKVVNLKTDQLKRQNELLAHLQANHIHYSQTVFRALDSSTLVTLLSKFKLNGKALIDQVEPKVLAVAGNYLVLRAPIDDEEVSGVKDAALENISWSDVLSEREIKFDKTDKRLVPIPTSGVFAEAVLGRSNSAEKLDITRFWNWQDSPIPLQPPEISPVGTGSRATPENLTPGQLSSPLLNIVNPTSLPDPTGISAGLNALTSANLFRDMSGLAGTQSLAESASSGTLSAATSAGELASANLKTEAEKAVAMGQIASDIAKAAMGIPPTGGNSGISGDGAKINHGKDMDARGEQSPAEQPTNSSVTSSTPNTTQNSGGRERAYSDQAALGYSPEGLREAVVSSSAPEFAQSREIVEPQISKLSLSSGITLNTNMGNPSGGRVLIVNFGTFFETSRFKASAFKNGFLDTDVMLNDDPTRLLIDKKAGIVLKGTPDLPVLSMFHLNAKTWESNLGTSSDPEKYRKVFEEWLAKSLVDGIDCLYLTGHSWAHDEQDRYTVSSDEFHDSFMFTGRRNQSDFEVGPGGKREKFSTAKIKSNCKLIFGFGCKVATSHASEQYQTVFGRGDNDFPVICGWNDSMSIPGHNQNSVIERYFEYLSKFAEANNGPKENRLEWFYMTHPLELVKAWGFATHVKGKSRARARGKDGILRKMKFDGTELKDLKFDGSDVTLIPTQI